METIKIIESISKYFDCEITGSFKFYMLGLLENYGDIDIITTKEEKIKIVEFIKDNGFYQDYTTKYQEALNDPWSYVHKWSEETKEKNRNEKIYFDYFTNGKEKIHFILVKKVEKINEIKSNLKFGVPILNISCSAFIVILIGNARISRSLSLSFQKSRRSKVEVCRVGYVRAYWIGSFMSGQPSCAMTEPSQNWTIEWMMLCGWTTTCILS